LWSITKEDHRHAAAEIEKKKKELASQIKQKPEWEK